MLIHPMIACEPFRAAEYAEKFHAAMSIEVKAFKFQVFNHVSLRENHFCVDINTGRIPLLFASTYLRRFESESSK